MGDLQVITSPKRAESLENFIWRVTADRTLSNEDVGALMRLVYVSQHPEDEMFYIDPGDWQFQTSLRKLELAGFVKVVD